MLRKDRFMSIDFPSLGLRSMMITCIVIASSVTTYGAEEPWKEQNRLLRAQLEAQQHELDGLRVQIDRLATSQEKNSGLKESESSSTAPQRSDRKLVISSEMGIAFFSTSEGGQYPNKEFRVDDAILRIDASIAHNTYFFGELWLSRHESLDEGFHLGEFYLEYENLSGALGLPERLVNVRFGRVNIPFAEEYQHRNPLGNPLVTHSLSDIWGTDEGIEVYGEFERASYALAIQNGSSKTMHDYNADKSLTLRFGYEVTSKLHLSASGMRTGKLASAFEPYSEIWLGNNVFRNIGSSASSTHQAEIAELDAVYTWHTGHLAAAAGRARYRDNDPLADNTRHFAYTQIEGVQSLTSRIYGALRLSSLRVDHGYPLAGIGRFAEYYVGGLRTKELQRLSLGGGYRFNRSLILKADYTVENGELTNGASRDTHMFSFESALGF